MRRTAFMLPPDIKRRLPKIQRKIGDLLKGNAIKTSQGMVEPALRLVETDIRFARPANYNRQIMKPTYRKELTGVPSVEFVFADKALLKAVELGITLRLDGVGFKLAMTLEDEPRMYFGFGKKPYIAIADMEDLKGRVRMLFSKAVAKNYKALAGLLEEDAQVATSYFQAVNADPEINAQEIEGEDDDLAPVGPASAEGIIPDTWISFFDKTVGKSYVITTAALQPLRVKVVGFSGTILTLEALEDFTSKKAGKKGDRFQIDLAEAPMNLSVEQVFEAVMQAALKSLYQVHGRTKVKGITLDAGSSSGAHPADPQVDFTTKTVEDEVQKVVQQTPAAPSLSNPTFASLTGLDIWVDTESFVTRAVKNVTGMEVSPKWKSLMRGGEDKTPTSTTYRLDPIEMPLSNGKDLSIKAKFLLTLDVSSGDSVVVSDSETGTFKTIPASDKRGLRDYVQSQLRIGITSWVASGKAPAQVPAPAPVQNMAAAIKPWYADARDRVLSILMDGVSNAFDSAVVDGKLTEDQMGKYLDQAKSKEWSNDMSADTVWFDMVVELPNYKIMADVKIERVGTEIRAKVNSTGLESQGDVMTWEDFSDVEAFVASLDPMVLDVGYQHGQKIVEMLAATDGFVPIQSLSQTVKPFISKVTKALRDEFKQGIQVTVESAEKQNLIPADYWSYIQRNGMFYAGWDEEGSSDTSVRFSIVFEANFTELATRVDTTLRIDGKNVLASMHLEGQGLPVKKTLNTKDVQTQNALYQALQEVIYDLGTARGQQYVNERSPKHLAQQKAREAAFISKEDLRDLLEDAGMSLTGGFFHPSLSDGIRAALEGQLDYTFATFTDATETKVQGRITVEPIVLGATAETVFPETKFIITLKLKEGKNVEIKIEAGKLKKTETLQISDDSDLQDDVGSTLNDMLNDMGFDIMANIIRKYGLERLEELATKKDQVVKIDKSDLISDLKSALGRGTTLVDESDTHLTFDPPYRQRLDHYGNDGDGWDEEGWQENYAGDLYSKAEEVLKKYDPTGKLLSYEVSEKGHFDVSLWGKRAVFASRRSGKGVRVAHNLYYRIIDKLDEKGIRYQESRRGQAKVISFDGNVIEIAPNNREWALLLKGYRQPMKNLDVDDLDFYV